MAIISQTRATQLLGMLDALEMPGLLLDPKGTIIAANERAHVLFQYAAADLEGQSMQQLVSSHAAADGTWEAGVPDTNDPVVTKCRRKNGEEFEAQLSVAPASEGDLRLVAIRDRSEERDVRARAIQRRKEFSAFSSFARIQAAGARPDELMREAVSVLMGALGADAGWVHLREAENSDTLELTAAEGCPEDFRRNIQRLRAGQCLAGKVILSGKPLLADRASEDPRLTYADTSSAGYESVASVPLVSRGSVLGTLSLASRNPNYFTAMDMGLFTTLGTQLGVALDNARLIDQLREKMDHIRLTGELIGTINSSLSLGTIFRIMVAEIRKFIGYSRASLLLHDEQTGNLVIFALDTEMKTVMPKGVRAPLEGTSAGWVFRNNRPWISRDLQEHVEFALDEKLKKEGIRSTISIPLWQDKMLGVFNLDSTEPHVYSERDLDILLPVARHIAVAIENALLFEEISREKREWERTFDAISDMVWIKDFRQGHVRANRAFLGHTGLSVADLAGECCVDLLARVGINVRECLCGNRGTTAGTSFLEVVGRGGSIFHFWAYPLVDEEGQLYAMIHYLKDVTERVRLEQQLVRADRMASLGTLAAGIAHEVNNPLGIIAGYAEALLGRSRDEDLSALPAFADFTEYLETIHQEIFRCKRILASLLEFARPQRGVYRELDINELIKEVMLLVNHQAKLQHRHLALDLRPDLPKICADAGSLRQLFMNLIINAMHFTPEEGRIQLSTDLASEESRRGMVAISVSDTGPGIARESIGKIFDPFFTTKPVGEGTGLGLSISHRIAQEHGGAIDVQSEPGQGATFTIYLPAKGTDDKAACC